MPEQTREHANEVLARFMGLCVHTLVPLPDDEQEVEGSECCRCSTCGAFVINDWGDERYKAAVPEFDADLSLLLGKGGVWARMSEEQRQRAHRIHFRAFTGLEPVGACSIMLNAIVEHGPEPLARACAEAVAEKE